MQPSAIRKKKTGLANLTKPGNEFVLRFSGIKKESVKSRFPYYRNRPRQPKELNHLEGLLLIQDYSNN